MGEESESLSLTRLTAGSVSLNNPQLLQYSSESIPEIKSSFLR